MPRRPISSKSTDSAPTPTTSGGRSNRVRGMKKTVAAPASLVTLKKRKEFVLLTKKADHVATKGLVLLALDKSVACPDLEGDTDIHVGFTATKKIGNAVARNRAKRRLRALAREGLAAKGNPNKAYVLIARYHTNDRPFSSLKKDLLYALHATKSHR